MLRSNNRLKTYVIPKLKRATEKHGSSKGGLFSKKNPLASQPVSRDEFFDIFDDSEEEQDLDLSQSRRFQRQQMRINKKKKIHRKTFHLNSSLALIQEEESTNIRKRNICAMKRLKGTQKLVKMRVKEIQFVNECQEKLSKKKDRCMFGYRKENTSNNNKSLFKSGNQFMIPENYSIWFLWDLILLVVTLFTNIIFTLSQSPADGNRPFIYFLFIICEIISRFIRGQELIKTTKKYLLSSLFFDLAILAPIEQFSNSLQWLPKLLSLLAIRYHIRAAQTLGLVLKIILTPCFYGINSTVTIIRPVVFLLKASCVGVGLSLLIIQIQFAFLENYDPSTSMGVFNMVPLSYYFVTNTITTAGYGDLLPESPREQLFLIGVELAGVIFYSYSFNKALQVLKASRAYAEALFQEKQKVVIWVHARERRATALSKFKIITLIGHYLFHQLKLCPFDTFNNRTFLQICPSLRDQLQQPFINYLLLNFSFFKSLEFRTFKRLACLLEAQLYHRGDCVQSIGSMPVGLFFITSGAVQISLKNKRSVKVMNIGKGCYFGEEFLFGELPRREITVTSKTLECYFLSLAAIKRHLNKKPKDIELIKYQAMIKQAALLNEDNIFYEMVLDLVVEIEKELTNQILMSSALYSQKRQGLFIRGGGFKRKVQFEQSVQFVLQKYIVDDFKAVGFLKIYTDFIKSCMTEYSVEELSNLRSLLQTKLCIYPKDINEQSQLSLMSSLPTDKHVDTLFLPEPEPEIVPESYDLDFDSIQEPTTLRLRESLNISIKKTYTKPKMEAQLVDSESISQYESLASKDSQRLTGFNQALIQVYKNTKNIEESLMKSEKAIQSKTKNKRSETFQDIVLKLLKVQIKEKKKARANNEDCSIEPGSVQSENDHLSDSVIGSEDSEGKYFDHGVSSDEDSSEFPVDNLVQKERNSLKNNIDVREKRLEYLGQKIFQLREHLLVEMDNFRMMLP